MKVGEQALYLAQLKGMAKKEAKEKLNYWFEKLGQPWWNKKLKIYQRVWLKKFNLLPVLHESKVLILDEPLSGLDQ